MQQSECVCTGGETESSDEQLSEMRANAALIRPAVRARSSCQ